MPEGAVKSVPVRGGVRLSWLLEAAAAARELATLLGCTPEDLEAEPGDAVVLEIMLRMVAGEAAEGGSECAGVCD